MRVPNTKLSLACVSMAILFGQASIAIANETPRPRSAPVSGTDRFVLQGQLKNGLRYAVVSRETKEPGVAMLFRVTGGFIAERRPAERGLAHLIEHLIFHSPTSTAPNELRRFRQVGMPLTLPEPAGGTTTWRESDYFVVSRTTQPADLSELFGLFREVFSEITFRADTVDEQRSEVMREMSAKKLGNDIYSSYIAAVAPGSPTHAIDAQNSDDVPTASVDTIRTLYRRLYRPENVTVVLVGNLNPTQVKILIEQAFDDWRGTGTTPARVTPPVVTTDHVAAISFSDFRYGRNIAMITAVSRLQRAQPLQERQAEVTLMDMLAMRAVNSRLARSQGDFPPGKYGIFIENGEQGHRLINIWDNFAPGKWRVALAGLKSVTCDLTTSGFSEPEWAAAKQGLLEELEGRANANADVPNFEIAKEVSTALVYGRTPRSAHELLTFARAWLPTLTTRQGSEWWRQQWAASVEHVRVESTEFGLVNDPNLAIRTAADEAVNDASCKVR